MYKIYNYSSGDELYLRTKEEVDALKKYIKAKSKVDEYLEVTKIKPISLKSAYKWADDNGMSDI